MTYDEIIETLDPILKSFGFDIAEPKNQFKTIRGMKDLISIIENPIYIELEHVVAKLNSLDWGDMSRTCCIKYANKSEAWINNRSIKSIFTNTDLIEGLMKD